MIKSFADKATAALFLGKRVKQVPADLQKRARIKLSMIEQARVLDDLKSPPANRIEALKGDRKDQYSICINQQWRICFISEDGSAYEVEIVDYH